MLVSQEPIIGFCHEKTFHLQLVIHMLAARPSHILNHLCIGNIVVLFGFFVLGYTSGCKRLFLSSVLIEFGIRIMPHLFQQSPYH